MHPAHRLLAVASLTLAASGHAHAWDAVGHRAITWLALDALAPDAPEFLKAPDTRDAIAWQSAEPDRWRGVNSTVLRHENAMDHYLDVEDLAGFGLDLTSMSPLRYRFVRDMAIARHTAAITPAPTGEPAQQPRPTPPPYNPRLDPAGDKEWVGFAPHEIVEHHARLVSHFKTYRALVTLNDPDRAPHLAQTKANIAFTMGVMSHFVGDLAQPLHTTKHFNGWVGDNPDNYTTSKAFHAWIDGGILFQHKLDYHALKPTQTFSATVDGRDPWAPTIAFLRRSHARVEPLYKLERDASLERDQGKKFITSCLHDGADMLAAYYNSAWQASAVSDRDIRDFERYDAFDPSQPPGATPQQRDSALTPRATLAPAPGQRPAANRVRLVGTVARLAPPQLLGERGPRSQAPDPATMGELTLSDGSVLLPEITLHRVPAIGQRVEILGRLAPLEPDTATQARWRLSVEDWRDATPTTPATPAAPASPASPPSPGSP